MFVAIGVIHVCALLLIKQGKTLLDMCVEFWLLEQFVFKWCFHGNNGVFCNYSNFQSCSHPLYLVYPKIS